jgi:hypothetical protein
MNSKNSSHKNKPRLATWIYLVLILSIALFIRLAGIWRSEPIDYHPDEWVIAKPVTSIANSGQVGLKTHYKWPACSLIYSLGYGLYAIKPWFGPYSYNSILIILRIVSALASTAAVLIAFLLIKKLVSLRAALLAAALLAVAKLPVSQGHYGTVTSIVSLIVLAIMLLSYDLFDVEHSLNRPPLKAGRCCLLGFLCGWGIAAKWTVLLSAIPISGAFLISVWLRRKLRSWGQFIKVNFKRFAIIAGMTALTFLAGIPDFQLVPEKVVSGLTYEMQHGKTGHYGTITAEKISLSEKLQRTFQAMGRCGNIYLLIAGIAATILCLVRPSREKMFLLWVMFAWLSVLIRNVSVFERHHLVPFIVMLMLIAIALEVGTKNRRQWIRVTCWIVFVFLMVSEILYTCIAISPFWKPDARVKCSKWIMANVPSGSGVTWAPRTADWAVPGMRISPSLFKAFPRRPEPGKYQYIIADNTKLTTFKKHPPTRKIVPSEWFPAKPPTMAELMLYAEMNNGGGPNLDLVKKFQTKPSFLGLDLTLFGQSPSKDLTFANRGVTLFRLKEPRQAGTTNDK